MKFCYFGDVFSKWPTRIHGDDMVAYVLAKGITSARDGNAMMTLLPYFTTNDNCKS